MNDAKYPVAACKPYWALMTWDGSFYSASEMDREKRAHSVSNGSVVRVVCEGNKDNKEACSVLWFVNGAQVASCTDVPLSCQPFATLGGNEGSEQTCLTFGRHSGFNMV